MVRVGLIGLGKMGLSHCALLRAHPEVELAGICDSSGIALGVLTRYTGLRGFTDYREMLDQCELDAVVIATPSKSHAALVDDCLDRSLSVFCEKPFTLDADDSERLAQRASQLGVATHVGYHNRSVAAFAEVKRLLDAGAIGTVTQVLGEAYGPVVLRPKGGTWRSQRAEGGGCLYDYAAHVIDLLTWYLGPPQGVRGTVLTSVFSRDTDDQVTTNLIYPDDLTAQLSVNWSDESVRKMSTSLTLRGTNGRIYVDRQECQVYLRTPVASLPGYRAGWNVHYTTELTPPVWFYLRGEEYSAEIDHFVASVGRRDLAPISDFASSAVTDRVIGAIVSDARGEPPTSDAARPLDPPPTRRRSRPRGFGRIRPVSRKAAAR